MNFSSFFPIRVGGGPNIPTGCQSTGGEQNAGDLNLDGQEDMVSFCQSSPNNPPLKYVRISDPDRGLPYLEQIDSWIRLKKGVQGFKSGDPFSSYRNNNPTIISVAASKGQPLFSPGNLVFFKDKDIGTRTGRIHSFLFEFDANGALVRRAALFSDGWDVNREGGIDLDQLTVVQRASKLDRIADRFIADLKTAQPKAVARRKEILSCADYKDLKDPAQAKVQRLEARMAVFLDRKIGALELDYEGKRFLHLKLEKKLELHNYIWALAATYAYADR